MIKINTSEMKELAGKTGFKNIGITFRVNGEDYLSCTCGCFKKVSDSMRIRTANYSDIYKVAVGCGESEKEVSDNIEKYVGSLVCPDCGTPIVFEDIDSGHDSFPVKYIPEIIQDDENFLVVKVCVEGAVLRDYIVSAFDEDNDSQVLMYDKVHKKFFFVSRIRCLSYAQECGEEKIFYPGLELKGNVLCYKDDGIGSISAGPDFSDFYAENVYCSSLIMNEACGLQDILNIFNKAAGTDIQFDGGYSFSETLALLFNSINFHYDNSALPRWACNKTSRFEENAEFYVRLVNAGVDPDAETAEKAFGMSVEELNNLCSIGDYVSMKEVKKRIAEAGLSGEEFKLLSRVPRNRRNVLFEIADFYGKDIRTVIRSVVYCRGMDITEAISLLLTISKNFKDSAAEIVNLESPVTPALKRKYFFVKNGMLTANQFDRLAKKPTLDTFHKVIS